VLNKSKTIFNKQLSGSISQLLLKANNLDRMKKIFLVTLMATGLVVAKNEANAQTKIGYINLNEVIATMPEAKKADSSLAQYQEALIADAKEKEQTLNADIQKFNADSAKMSQAVKDLKRKKLQEQYQSLAQEDQRIQQELQKKQEELSVPIQKKAIDAVNTAAKEAGYTYVFLKEALLVSPPADDLLPLVKKKLGIK
jgi:outer membrane protein